MTCRFAKDTSRSRMLPYALFCFNLYAAFGMDFLSPGGRSTLFSLDLRQTPDRLHAQHGMLG